MPTSQAILAFNLPPNPRAPNPTHPSISAPTPSRVGPHPTPTPSGSRKPPRLRYQAVKSGSTLYRCRRYGYWASSAQTRRGERKVGWYNYISPGCMDRMYNVSVLFYLHLSSRPTASATPATLNIPPVPLNTPLFPSKVTSGNRTYPLCTDRLHAPNPRHPNSSPVA